MRITRFFTIMFLGILCLAASSCKKEEILTFGAQMDQFTATDADGSKTYLGHAEQWIYWEEDDSIIVNDGSNNSICTIVSGIGALDAFFKSETTVNTDATLYAIYPPKSYGTSYTDLVFPATQPYRQSTSIQHPDSSFGRGAMPMVAYSAPGMLHHGAIYFHVVAGILRVQILSSESKNVSQITFKEVGGEHGASNRQISGHFTVNDITENAPYLTGTSVNDADRTITITDINQEIGPDKLLTFYLPLPSVDVDGNGPSSYIPYNIRMTVKTTDNKYFSRDFKADIHRRNITMMRALNITSWSDAPDGGTSTVQLVGSGTKDRPFQIYSGTELMQVRDAFKNGWDINGQPITSQTYFKIVRSDITLYSPDGWSSLSDAEKNNPANVLWTEGIPNFKGYMYFASSTAYNGGITNKSNQPLFESITYEGVVNRVYVKGDNSPAVANGQYFSPMCNVNNGMMIECHNKSNVTITSTGNLAGLCVTNNGSIEGGANEGTLKTNGNVAGICFTNNDYIQGNFSLSVAVPQGANIAGIVYRNNGSVEDCLVTTNMAINSTGNWGIIAFENNDLIKNCSSSGTVLFTVNGSVGGICNINNNTVCNSSCNVEIRASQGNVGGIVATMNNSNGRVYNCRTTTMSVTGAVSSNVADNCGGIVGELIEGVVYNCYCTSFVTGAINSGCIIGKLYDNTGAVVQNCYSRQTTSDFVGAYVGSAQLGDFCFSPNQTDIDHNANRITTTATTIGGVAYDAYDIVEMQSTQDLDGAVTPDSYVGSNCSIALNDWVNYRGSQASYIQTYGYFNWNTTGANNMPVFATPTKSSRSIVK